MRKMNTIYVCLALFCVAVYIQAQGIPREARWCTVSKKEHKKCEDLERAMGARWMRNKTVPAGWKNYDQLPALKCVLPTVQATDVFACMDYISNNKADLMSLDPGMGFTAGQYFTMMPLIAEKYDTLPGHSGLDFKAVVVVKRGSGIDITTLKDKKACLPGVGHAAGWIYPISILMQRDENQMDIVECNVPVKSASSFFGDMCAPHGLSRFYNPFGTNPVSVCKTCKGTFNEFCTGSDPYAGYHGAFNCLANDDGEVAFIRDSTIRAAMNGTEDINDYELVCMDGSVRPASQYNTCNWGTIPSHIVMTSAIHDFNLRKDFKDLLKLIAHDFGNRGFHNDLINVFDSTSYGLKDLLFTDESESFIDVAEVDDGNRDTYYTWVGEEFNARYSALNTCPLQQARWCVISQFEMRKCENMIMAFAAKGLKPDLNCILGESIRDCMDKIRTGDADMMALDAADVFIAGKHYNLVPIASEDYSGYESKSYYAVAVARKVDSYLTIFNLKSRRTCHPGVMTAAGWVVPVDKLIETIQIQVHDRKIYQAVGQLFSKSCVPGVLSSYYNPHGTNPINLCEACASGGRDRCKRNDDELYYGNSGAFRCLTEKGGDVAFVKHTTVRENTNRNNRAEWARNRRSDDYQLLCNDGTRREIDDWADCNLGVVPANAIVTADFKTPEERDIYWTLLNYAQQTFASDSDTDFSMFNSEYLDHSDLIFQDSTVRLMPIHRTNQTYDKYLGKRFLRSMERLAQNDDITAGSAPLYSTLAISLHTIAMFIFTLFLL